MVHDLLTGADTVSVVFNEGQLALSPVGFWRRGDDGDGPIYWDLMYVYDQLARTSVATVVSSHKFMQQVAAVVQSSGVSADELHLRGKSSRLCLLEEPKQLLKKNCCFSICLSGIPGRPGALNANCATSRVLLLYMASLVEHSRIPEKANFAIGHFNSICEKAVSHAHTLGEGYVIDAI
jgi:hypothetical protein